MNFLKVILDYIKNIKMLHKLIIIIVAFFIVLIVSSIIWYKSSLSAVSKIDTPVTVSIEIGSSSNSIATTLKNADIIKSKLAFKLYIKLNSITGLKAGNYNLNKNMNIKQIIEVLKTGIVMKEQINITFLEGKNMRWIASKIDECTNNSAQDVFNLLNNDEYIDSLIDDYWFISDVIKDDNIYYSLEGYLFPDTYYFDGTDVSVQEIFKCMLDKMDTVLKEYALKGKNTHDILTLASIVELEGVDTASRKSIASVFYNRINSNMSLGSDVTTYYAYNIDMGDRDLTTAELYTYNPYNTRGPQMFGKLPIGPIASPSKSSIEAVINPDSTNYLYFVADKNGKVYFTETLSQHQQIIQELKNDNLWFIY